VDAAVRDALEVLIVLAVGGILWSAIARLRRGQVTVTRCGECGRPASRVYATCPHCGADL
jgi:uncharacterized OB-fold protein